MTDFHFLRPLWLLLLPCVLLLSWWWRGQGAQRGGWADCVDAHLLGAQFQLGGDAYAHWIRKSIPVAVAIAVLAGAGPAWEKVDTQVGRQQQGRVFVLDISQSMNAADLKPSRLTLARLKLIDLLQASRDRQVGLVVFAASPYVVSPLTDDALTLRETATAITTALAPTQGANIGEAILYAQGLLRQSGLPGGEIVLITDSAPDQAALDAAEQAADAGVPVSVMAVGSLEGAPVPGRNGRAIRGADGRPLIVSTPQSALNKLAAAGQGRFALLRADGSDVQALLPRFDVLNATDAGAEQQRSTQLWLDRGPWLLWLLAPWGCCLFWARWF